MRINFRILGQAIWDIIKFPLMIIATALGVVVSVSFLIYLLHAWALPVVFGIIMLTLTSSFIHVRYKELLEKHNREQQIMMDILKR